MIKIYGASDDLIEVVGDIEVEFCIPSGGRRYLALSNGWLLSVEYVDDGVWSIRPIHRGPGGYLLTLAAGADSPDYSDTLTIDEPCKWVMMGSELHSLKPLIT